MSRLWQRVVTPIMTWSALDNLVLITRPRSVDYCVQTVQQRSADAVDADVDPPALLTTASAPVFCESSGSFYPLTPAAAKPNVDKATQSIAQRAQACKLGKLLKAHQLVTARFKTTARIHRHPRSSSSTVAVKSLPRVCQVVGCVHSMNFVVVYRFLHALKQSDRPACAGSTATCPMLPFQSFFSSSLSDLGLCKLSGDSDEESRKERLFFFFFLHQTE